MTLSKTADRIRALMADDPSQPLNLLRLAQTGETLTGTMDLGLLQRAASMLVCHEGKLDFELKFTLDAERRIIIAVSIATLLEMSCQRCLQSMQVEVDRESSLAVVKDRQQLADLPRQHEPLLLSEQEQVTLTGLIEDELILAIPLAPMHDAALCSASAMLERFGTAEKAGPFAELAKLKNTND